MSLIDFCTFQDKNIYADLLRELIKNGHTVYCVSPVERKVGKNTYVIEENGSYILKQKIGNIQKVNIIEKGISTLLIQNQFIRGINKHFKGVKFDLVLYATPPITFAKVIRSIKKRDNARAYLMLKDIFPQNSVDLKLLSTHGIKGFIYKYFRQKEKKLYALSDAIGCMSAANCEFLIRHNPDVPKEKVHIFPNCIEPIDMRISDEEKRAARTQYGLPLDKKIFVYGGNLGRPQDVPFIVRCLKAAADINDVFFVIAGSGTDKHFLEQYVQTEKPEHIKLFGHIPKEEYDRMIACCDVGLIFLDHRFTIPNFPSRLLSYMQAGLPVLACTDKNTDIGTVIIEGGFGVWCESDDEQGFKESLRLFPMPDAAERSFEYLKENYSTEACCPILEKFIGSDVRD